MSFRLVLMLLCSFASTANAGDAPYQVESSATRLVVVGAGEAVRRIELDPEGLRVWIEGRLRPVFVVDSGGATNRRASVRYENYCSGAFTRAHLTVPGEGIERLTLDLSGEHAVVTLDHDLDALPDYTWASEFTMQLPIRDCPGHPAR